MDSCCATVTDAGAKRRACGCLRTCDKVKALLDRFPSAPPPPPSAPPPQPQSQLQPTTVKCGGDTEEDSWETNRIYTFLNNIKKSLPNANCNAMTFSTRNQPINFNQQDDVLTADDGCKSDMQGCRGSKQNSIITELGQILQLSVTASALIIYYVVYCYMQLVYFALRSAVYFHNADGSMKVTIAVVLMSTILVGINIFVKFERIFGFLF